MPEDRAMAPVPALTGRQFVVRTSEAPSNDIKERELFWYREELFTKVRARWREVNGDRNGELVMRDHRLTQEMLGALKLERFHIDLQLAREPVDVSPAKESFSAIVETSTDEFCFVKIKVKSNISCVFF
jgi:hypothetical protein